MVNISWFTKVLYIQTLVVFRISQPSTVGPYKKEDLGEKRLDDLYKVLDAKSGGDTNYKLRKMTHVLFGEPKRRRRRVPFNNQCLLILSGFSRGLPRLRGCVERSWAEPQQSVAEVPAASWAQVIWATPSPSWKTTSCISRKVGITWNMFGFTMQQTKIWLHGSRKAALATWATPWRMNGWNPKMEVWFRWFVLSIGWFLHLFRFQPLIFRGVSFLVSCFLFDFYSWCLKAPICLKWVLEPLVSK